MIKKFVSLVALSLVLVSETAMIAPKAVTANSMCPNCVAETEKPSETTEDSRHKDKDKDKKEDKCEDRVKHDVKILSKDCYLKLLTEDEKKDLKEICDCVNSGKELSKDQVKKIESLKEKIAKSVLGDKDYKEFKKLLKQEKHSKLCDEDKAKLNEYFKKLRDAN